MKRRGLGTRFHGGFAALVLTCALPARSQPAADGAASGASLPQPPSAAASAGAAGVQAPRYLLTEQEAIARALGFSPALESAGLSVQNAQQQLRAEDGRYPYSLVADATLSNATAPQLRADNSVATSKTQAADLSVGVRRVFPFGATAEVRASQQYFDRNIQATTLNPYTPASTGHTTSVRASVTQPLLRGFGSGVGEVELRAARANQGAAESGLNRARSQLARDVALAYQELWYAEQALVIEQSSLALTQEQERQARDREAVGALALAEVLAFQTRSAERIEAVVTAELTLNQRSLALAQLIGSMGVDPQSLRASSAPDPAPPPPTQAMLEKVLASDSVELAELEARIRTAEVRLAAAGDGSRPRLDAQASAQSNGVSTEFPTAWERAAGGEWWTAQVGVSLELPLDTRRQQALVAQAKLAVLSARADLRAAQNRVAAEAATALANDRATRARLQNAEVTRDLAQRSYDAAAARFELGQTIAITLQQAQDDLRRAQLRVVRARVDLQQQATNIEHLTGALAARYAPEGAR